MVFQALENLNDALENDVAMICVLALVENGLVPEEPDLLHLRKSGVQNLE